MTLRRVLVAALVSTACRSAVPPPSSSAPPPVVQTAWPPAPPPGANAALAPVAWLLGDWHSVDGDLTEHWVAAGGTLYGVRMGGTYAVMLIDDGDGDSDVADGVRRYLALGDGHAGVEYREEAIERDHARFAAGAEAMDYRLRDGVLVVGYGNGEKWVELEFRREAGAPAGALEQADRAFADDTAARGVDGWIAWFAPDGALWRGARIEGRAAIGEKMAPTLSRGVLAWQPIASRARGQRGFTVGTATFTAKDATAPGWRGSYVTIWELQPDGTWRAVLDTGRGEQPLPTP